MGKRVRKWVGTVEFNLEDTHLAKTLLKRYTPVKRTPRDGKMFVTADVVLSQRQYERLLDWPHVFSWMLNPGK
jgi:hypothetical protein